MYREYLYNGEYIDRQSINGEYIEGLYVIERINISSPLNRGNGKYILAEYRP